MGLRKAPRGKKKRPPSSKKATGYSNSLDSVRSEMSSLNPLYHSDKQLDGER